MEDLSPSETTQTSTGTIYSTERPQPTQIKDQTTNTEPNGAVTLALDPFPWTMVIVAFVIILVIAVAALAFFKNRPTHSVQKN